MGDQQLYWGHPQKFSQGFHSLCICHGLIQKHGPKMCCQFLHQYSKDIGFIKLD
ncbi:40S ribosomal protein S29-like [Choloepus didactylus]|uniref:40S ribosomal protein S29-like n=1 Tax=Choloepus didactylus TaxID=27675 RepID=UPI00189E5C2B|nr:40S ribosomal protein S29-like [Choloepus didactylus]